MRFGLRTVLVVALCAGVPQAARCEDGPLGRNNLPPAEERGPAPWSGLQRETGLRMLNVQSAAGDRLDWQRRNSPMWARWAQGMPQARLTGLGDGPFVAKKKPWSSEFWAFSTCNMAFDRRDHLVRNGSPLLSPLEVVDSMALTMLGFNPGSAAFEANSYHNGGGSGDAGWSGHCNGWSAASLLEEEPPDSLAFDLGKEVQLVELNNGSSTRKQEYGYKAAKKTGSNTITLSRAQMKGILTEVYHAIRAVTSELTFNRLSEPPYREYLAVVQNTHRIQYDPGATGINEFSSEGPNDHQAALSGKDTLPHIMHSYLAQCLDRNVPIVADTSPGDSKHNHPIYHYEYKVDDSKTAEEELKVPWEKGTDGQPKPATKTKVKTETISYKIICADYAAASSAGTVPLELTGKYRTKQRESDQMVVTSEWLPGSRHPDFMWLPVPEKFVNQGVNAPLVNKTESKGAMDVWLLIRSKIKEKNTTRPSGR